MELFAQRTGTRLVHVPYAGGAAAVADLVAGRTQLAFLNVATVLPQVRSGALRAIAVSSPAIYPSLPEVPTVKTSLPDFQGGSWHGFVGPKGMPAPLLDRIHAALAAALRAPEVAERLIRIGFTVEATSRADFAARIEREFAGWRNVVQAAGLAAD